MATNLKKLRALLLDRVPADGSSVGNGRLRQLVAEALGAEVDDADYAKARDALVAEGVLARGQGRGGSVRRITASEATAHQPEPEEADEPGDQGTRDDDAPPPSFSLESPTPREPRASKAPASKKAAPTSGKVSSSRGSKDEEAQVVSYRHKDRRKNNPEVGMVDPDTDPVQPKTRWAYDPHIDPALQFDVGRAQTEKLIDDALASGDEAVMRAALEQLRRQAEPYLAWAGKAERTSFEIDTVSLHVHERIDPASILAAVRKAMKADKDEAAQPKKQLGLFAAPFENLPLRDAIDFYKHDKGWSNRLIAGDSLLVMNSLLQKEGMAGQVQMVFIDPPYGIKYGSNFQPFTNKREVRDGKDEDLTQEPEMLKAFRDTWQLGLHSYLSYLRDRLQLTRELLADSGSVFVQISDENIHHVREVLDEVMGSENFIAQITFSKTTGSTNNFLPGTADYLLWYARDRAKVRYRALYKEKAVGAEGATAYTRVELPNGERRTMTAGERADSGRLPRGARVYTIGDLTSQSEGREKGEGAACWFPVRLDGADYRPSIKGRWKTNELGMQRLLLNRRLEATDGNSLRYVRFIDDFATFPITNNWTDTGTAGFASDKKYVVETNTKVIERCLLMTTDPGDLVLDPTCGSGTTALMAEKWGRRWITCDTSRVAVTLAKQRLMTASYEYFDLRYPHEGLKGGFVYKTLPHVMLKSIVGNPDLEEIHGRLQPAIIEALAALNTALRSAPPRPFAVDSGGREGTTVDFAAPTGKTIDLPSGEKAPAGALLEWEVPFDFPEGWSAPARKAFDAFHAARRTMQQQMDASIAAHADQEILYDQPQIARDKLRITGPFSVEAVPFPTVLALDEARQPVEADVAIARSGETSRQHQWRDELLKTGIRGKGGQMLKFAGLEALPETRYLHVSGTLADTGERVVVSFGPEHGALEQRQVEMGMREAGELFPRPKMIVYAAFAFDPEAAKDIDQTKGITALKVQMNTDLLTEDLKKNRSSNQSFWLMGQPDVEVRRRKDGLFEVEVRGFDYFDTVKGELVSGGKSKIAMWSLDTDYDERSLFPRQVFFPMAGPKDGWHKLRKDIRAELDESRLEGFHGTVSLPFDAGENRKVAVKVVDDRGIESLKVLRLD